MSQMFDEMFIIITNKLDWHCKVGIMSTLTNSCGTAHHYICG